MDVESFTHKSKIWFLTLLTFNFSKGFIPSFSFHTSKKTTQKHEYMAEYTISMKTSNEKYPLWIIFDINNSRCMLSFADCQGLPLKNSTYLNPNDTNIYYGPDQKQYYVYYHFTFSQFTDRKTKPWQKLYIRRKHLFIYNS